MRVTAKKLNDRLDEVNDMFNTSWQLNRNSSNGEWMLTSKTEINYHRASAKEMLALLDGMVCAFLLIPFFNKQNFYQEED